MVTAHTQPLLLERNRYYLPEPGPHIEDTEMLKMQEIVFELRRNEQQKSPLPPPGMVRDQVRKSLGTFFASADSILEDILKYATDSQEPIPLTLGRPLAFIQTFQELITSLNTGLRNKAYNEQEYSKEKKDMERMIEHYQDISHDMNNILFVASTIEIPSKRYFMENVPLIEHGLRIIRGSKGWETGYPVTAFPLLEEVIIPAAYMAERKHFITSPLDIKGEEAIIQGVEDQVYQAVYTLIKNSKFHGGKSDQKIRVGVSLEDTHIDDRQAVGIRIMDDGRGFPQEYSGIQRGYSIGPGLGLGLAFSETVCKRHGGYFTIHENGYGGKEFPGACVEMVIPKRQDTYAFSPLLKETLP